MSLLDESDASLIGQGSPIGAGAVTTQELIEVQSELLPAARGSRIRGLIEHRGLLTLVDQVVVSLTNFSTGILIGRFCSKETLGLYMLGYTVVLFAIAVQQMLVTSPYILIWPRLEAEAAQRYTDGAYMQQLSMGGTLSVALLIAAGIFHLAHSPLALVMLALAFSAPLLLFKEMFRRVCFTKLRVQQAMLADLAVGVLQVALLFLFARQHWLSAPTGMLAVGIASSVLLVAWMARYAKALNFHIAEIRDVLTKNWHLGRWIFGSQLLWSASLYSYPWLVSKMHGTAAAGVWAACFGINALGNPLLLGLQNYIEPKVSHAFATGGTGAMRQLVWKATAVLTGSMLLFSGGIFFAGNRLVVLLYGPKYAGNGLTIFLLTLSFAAGAAGFALSCGFFASGHGKLDLRISWVYPVAVCACGIPLVRLYGPIGGAVALLIAHMIAAMLRMLQFAVTFGIENERAAAR